MATQEQELEQEALGITSYTFTQAQRLFQFAMLNKELYDKCKLSKQKPTETTATETTATETTATDPACESISTNLKRYDELVNKYVDSLNIRQIKLNMASKNISINEYIQELPYVNQMITKGNLAGLQKKDGLMVRIRDAVVSKLSTLGGGSRKTRKTKKASKSTKKTKASRKTRKASKKPKVSKKSKKPKAPRRRKSRKGKH